MRRHLILILAAFALASCLPDIDEDTAYRVLQQEGVSHIDLGDSDPVACASDRTTASVDFSGVRSGVGVAGVICARGTGSNQSYVVRWF